MPISVENSVSKTIISPILSGMTAPAVVGATIISGQGVWLMKDSGVCEFHADKNFTISDYYKIISNLPTDYSYTYVEKSPDECEISNSRGETFVFTFFEMASFPKTIHRRQTANIYHLNFT